MSTAFILGKGAVLSASTNGTTFTPVNQLKQITFSGAQSDFVDVTNLGSTGAYKEFAPTLLDSGTATITGILSPSGDAGQTMVGAAFENQSLTHWKLQFSPAGAQTTGALRTFNAYVSKKPVMNAQLTDAVSFDFELKVSGPITDTAGA
jgi:hypothetical protein